jgi:tetratricopeptide (TPR) repeat protein
MSRHRVRCGVYRAALVCVLSVLSACTSAPKSKKTDDLAVKLAAQQGAEDKVSSADKALKEGHADEALNQLDAAIKLDPASKTPWLKKAQIHFDAQQYGQAITEAQEALQRDVSDLTAKSILAVSGLRVSAAALEQLRKVNEVTGSTREEAEGVAKLIREALGEPVLVPPMAGASSAESPARAVNAASGINRSTLSSNRTPPRVAVSRPVSTGAGAAPTAAPTVKATAAAATSGSSNGRNNPFGALQ